MGRIVVAVIAGYCAIGLMVVLTDQIAARVISGFSSMITPPAYYFYLSLATDTLYAMAGGFLCALIARNQARRATLGLILLGEVIGLVSQIALWSTVPHWFGLALLVIFPPAVWFGSRLRREHAIALS